MPSDCSDDGGNPRCPCRSGRLSGAIFLFTGMGRLDRMKPMGPSSQRTMSDSCGVMNREEIYNLIKVFFTEEFEISAEKVILEANLFNDLALDSIDALDMVGMLEARLGIEVREEDLKAIRTVRDVVDYICIKVEKRGEA
jgi:acyl carrier protein